MVNKQFYIYILSNITNSVLYIGVTNNLKRRVFEHKHSFSDGFTSKYNVHKLVYFEICDTPETAITREKQIKNYSRNKKNALIYSTNPNWTDLYEDLL